MAQSLEAESTDPSLTALPLDVFDQVLVRLDQSTLLRLSKVNRFFNRRALAVYFGTHAKDILHEYKFTNRPPIGSSSDTGPRALVQALCLALWITSLEHIDYHFTPSWRISFALDELAGLARFLERMPPTPSSFKSLRLEFSLLDPECRFETPIISKKCISDSKRWFGLVERIVNTALRRGCEVVEIKGKFAPWLFPALKQNQYFYKGEPHVEDAGGSVIVRPKDGRYSRFRKGISRLFTRISIASKHATPPHLGLQPPVAHDSWKLRELVISSATMLHPPARSYTRHILEGHSSTIRHLTLVSYNGEKVQFDRKKDSFLTSLNLPSLTSFALDGHTIRVPLEHLIIFLNQHSRTLTKLDLEQWGPRNAMNVKHRVKLPVLEKVRGRPNTICWILRDLEKGCPRLQRVWLVCYPQRKGEKAWDDEPLTAALLLCNTLGTPLIEFGMEVDFGFTRWRNWVSEQAAEGLQSDTAQLQWKTLVIHHRSENKDIPSIWMRDLVKWLSLFPKLEHLNLRGELFPLKELDTVLCISVKRCCKALKSFQYCGCRVEMDWMQHTEAGLCM